MTGQAAGVAAAVSLQQNTVVPGGQELHKLDVQKCWGNFESVGMGSKSATSQKI